MTATLTILGWDHPRCMRPLAAAATAWEQRGDGCPVRLCTRSGDAFAGQSLEDAVAAVDLVVIDHPFSGEGLATGTLVAIDDHLEPATLDALAADSSGPSHESYRWGGHQLALAADAACHAAAWRPDRLDDPPRTWNEVLALARRAPGTVALSIVGHAAICGLLTLCAGAGAGPQPDEEPLLDPEVATWAVASMLDLLGHAHPTSASLDVEQVLAAMHRGDEISYTPMAFPYTTFASPAADGVALRYGPPPVGDPGAAGGGALLGGTGLAISAHSPRPAQAAAFAAWYCGAEVQRTLVVAQDGQPASRAAWTDPVADARFGGMLSAVLPSLERAYVRPREPWWPAAQRDADELLREALIAGERPAGIVERLNRLFAAARGD